MKRPDPTKEAERLESLWMGEFGDAYVDRNRTVANHRSQFWEGILKEFPAESILEVGCNVGGNLTRIAELVPPARVFGIDVNAKALGQLHATSPAVNVVQSLARDLPFRHRQFDLTLTVGVLIHQPDESLSDVMEELVRCSRRFLLCGEYYAAEQTEVPYRGQTGALFKRDYGALYAARFSELRLRKRGFLSRAEGWDDVDYWVFEKC